MIRTATAQDVDAIVRMGLRFAGSEYAPYLTASSDCLRGFTERLIGADDGVIFVADGPDDLVGMLAMMAYTHPMSGEKVATELCWWIEPEARGGRAALRLIRAAEVWAQEHDAVQFQMIAPTDRVGEFYAVLGYNRVETTYQRRF